MNPNDLPGLDAWLTDVPEEESEEQEEEDSREDEEPDVCGQFYDGN